MNNNYQYVLLRLADERKRKKLTQLQLCSCMNMPQSNFSKSETGHRRFTYPELKGLCTSDLDIFYIFTGNRAVYKWEFLSPSGAAEEILCHLSTIYIQASAAKTLNRSRTSLEQVQKHLEYLQYRTGKNSTIIYSIRNYHGHTQKKMAELLGVDVKTLQRLEKGRLLPDSEIIWKIYDQFQVSPALILNDAKGLWNELNYVLGLLERDDREIMLQILENGHKLMWK